MARKGELGKSMIDRDWPHQAAIDAEQCTGSAHTRIHEFCRNRSLAPRGHSYIEDDRYMNVYCFAVRSDAEAFAIEIGGTIIDPAKRPRWPRRS